MALMCEEDGEVCVRVHEAGETPGEQVSLTLTLALLE
jgi:hypothetical protein